MTFDPWCRNPDGHTDFRLRHLPDTPITAGCPVCRTGTFAPTPSIVAAASRTEPNAEWVRANTRHLRPEDIAVARSYDGVTAGLYLFALNGLREMCAVMFPTLTRKDRQ